MSDCISRQAALDALNEQIEQCNKALGSFDISPKDEYAIKVERASLKAYKELIENLPPAQLDFYVTEKIDKAYDDGYNAGYLQGEFDARNEAMPPAPAKRGKWVKISPANIYECSKCGKHVMTNDISAYDFCHGCGADMRGGDNGKT